MVVHLAAALEELSPSVSDAIGELVYLVRFAPQFELEAATREIVTPW